MPKKEWPTRIVGPSCPASTASPSGERMTVPSFTKASWLLSIVVVEVVHHDAERFLDAARCGVSEPVDPLQTCAISQMKAGDRIGRLLGRGMARQIGCTTAQDLRLQEIIDFQCIEPPGTGLYPRQQRGRGITR